MPRGYDSYLMDSLCQSESEGEPVTAVTDATPARRPSLGEALPKILIRLEGCGITITLKAGPHVRLHKLLDKWKSCFPDPLSAPMAWPVSVFVGDEEIRVSSIQDSISRIIGPDRISRLSEDVDVVMISVGKPEGTDVAPPQPEELTSDPFVPENSKSEEDKLSMTGNRSSAATGSENVVQEEEKPKSCPSDRTAYTVRMLIDSKFAKKKCKMNVSSNCIVSRLIRKWTEAANVSIDPTKFVLFHEAGRSLDLSLSLHEALLQVGLVASEIEGRVNLEALLESEARPTKNSPEGRKRRKKEPEEEPILESPKLSFREQEAQLEFWSQMKSARSEGLEPHVFEEDQDQASEWEDDDMALAIALSLSETK
jgi:hypothetical protein